VDQPRRTDRKVIGHLTRVLAEYRQLEDVTGPRPVVEPIRAQLTLLDDLAANARGPVRDSVVELISHHAQFAGWLAEDTGNARRALTFYDRAMDAAQQVDDANMITSVLSLKSHLAWSRADAARAVALAQAGQRVNGHVSPGVLALVVQQEARGHALLGDADPTDRAMDRSEALTQEASEHAEDEPPWVYFQDPGRALFQRGIAYLELGRGQEAAELFERARLALAAAYRRDHGRYAAVTAHAYALSGEVEQATTLGREAATIAAETGSAHTAGDLRRMRRALNKWADDQRVRDLDVYVRDLVT
jgi:tetratricopeptide (TPR) repeat protein